MVAVTAESWSQMSESGGGEEGRCRAGAPVGPGPGDAVMSACPPHPAGRVM